MRRYKLLEELEEEALPVEPPSVAILTARALKVVKVIGHSREEMTSIGHVMPVAHLLMVPALLLEQTVIGICTLKHQEMAQAILTRLLSLRAPVSI